jgi:four helix bundle protein
VKINSFTDLTVWQRAHELSLMAYKLTQSFPRSEMFGIVSQLRRSSSSVPANIAEGFGRRNTRELLRSLQISAGELAETRYFLILSRDLGYLTVPAFKKADELCDSTGRLINALARSLRAKAGVN